MKFIRIVFSLLSLAWLLPVVCLAQGSAWTDDVAKLRAQIAAQQKQLDEQRQALESAQAAIDSQRKMLDRLVGARSAPAAAPTQSAATEAVQPAPILPPATGAAEADAKGRAFSPLAFHIGGADFTPAVSWISPRCGAPPTSAAASALPSPPFRSATPRRAEWTSFGPAPGTRAFPCPSRRTRPRSGRSLVMWRRTSPETSRPAC